MKKLYIFSLLVVTIFLLAGCMPIEPFTLAPTTQTTEAAQTTTETKAITTKTIDKDMVISDVYQMIYGDLYDEVKQEVLNNMSQEKFDQLYNQVISSILDKIVDGTITVTPASLIDMIYQVEETSAHAVIGITALDDTGTELQIGSGVIYKHVGDKYFVVTNHHVVDGGTSFEIYFGDKDNTIDANLVGVDTLVDVAVLSFVSDNTYQVANFGDSSQVRKGDIILAVGSPEGYDFFGSMTMGIVSGLDRYFDIDGDNVRDMFVNYIQHDAAINSGNSGGALFDVHGDVIGINVIKISDTTVEGMGFAIPSNLVKDICGDIEEFGVSLQKPVLGISFIEIRNNYDYIISQGGSIPAGIEDGFYVFDVVPGASFDGYVQPDDIIISIGDVTLTTAEDFVFDFSKYKVGDKVDITLYRSGHLITIPNIELKPKVGN